MVSEHFSCHHCGNFFPKIRAIHCNCITCEQAIVFLTCSYAILLTVCGFFYVHKGGRGGGGVDDDKTNHTFQWQGQLILGRCWAQPVCGFIIKISQMKKYWIVLQKNNLESTIYIRPKSILIATRFRLLKYHSRLLACITFNFVKGLTTRFSVFVWVFRTPRPSFKNYRSSTDVSFYMCKTAI